MRPCSRCGTPRGEGSFYTDGKFPADVCKPCIYRPHRLGVVRAERTRQQRERVAIQELVKQVQRCSESLVYVMRVARDVKIGFSTNVCKRIKQIETASSSPVQLLAVAPGGRQLEQMLHREFRHLRTRGEWFRVRQSDNLLPKFSQLLGAMIFLPGFVTVDAPLPALGVTKP